MTTPEATPTPRPWMHGPLFWEGWSVDAGVRVFEVPHTYPEGSHQAGVYIDPEIGRSREADAALIVEAVNNYDRLRKIEAAARTFFDDEHECLHADEPPCGLALLRAALDEESQP